MPQLDSTDEKSEYNKIIIIADPHGLVEELKEFLDKMYEVHGETIAYCIQLGDIWKGRNVINGEKTFSFWKDPTIFEKFPYPIYCIKGNEDVNIPEAWWKQGMISLLPNLEEFLIEDFKVIPIHFFEETQELYTKMGIKKIFHIKHAEKNKNNEYIPLLDYHTIKDQPVHPVLTSTQPIDFIISHVPPYGLLDKTRDALSHKEIRYTGNKLVRLIIDKRKPKVVFFGHNHFANYNLFGNMLVISCDKFVRKVPDWADEQYLDLDYKKNNRTHPIRENSKEKNLFSYCILIREGKKYFIEMYRRDRLIFKYDIELSKILISQI